MASPEVDSTVVADGLDGTFVERLPALLDFFFGFRLLAYVSVAFSVIPQKIHGCSLTTQVAVDALSVDVEAAGNVFRKLVFAVGHFGSRSGL
jgi:hypothetical protein